VVTANKNLKKKKKKKKKKKNKITVLIFIYPKKQIVISTKNQNHSLTHSLSLSPSLPLTLTHTAIHSGDFSGDFQGRVGERWEENEKARLSIMSDSCSDRFSDLLCGEGSEILSGESPECSSDLDSGPCIDESIAEFIEDERHFVPGVDYLARFRSQSLDASAREESVAWILKVRHFEIYDTKLLDFTVMPPENVSYVFGSKSHRNRMVRSELNLSSSQSRHPIYAHFSVSPVLLRYAGCAIHLPLKSFVFYSYHHNIILLLFMN